MSSLPVRYCSYCGKQMVEYDPRISSTYLWMACPRYTDGFSFWSFVTGNSDFRKHDSKIVGERGPNYDTKTGQRLGG